MADNEIQITVTKHYYRPPPLGTAELRLRNITPNDTLAFEIWTKGESSITPSFGILQPGSTQLIALELGQDDHSGYVVDPVQVRWRNIASNVHRVKSVETNILRAALIGNQTAPQREGIFQPPDNRAQEYRQRQAELKSRKIQLAFIAILFYAIGSRCGEGA